MLHPVYLKLSYKRLEIFELLSFCMNNFFPFFSKHGKRSERPRKGPSLEHSSGGGESCMTLMPSKRCFLRAADIFGHQKKFAKLCFLITQRRAEPLLDFLSGKDTGVRRSA